MISIKDYAQENGVTYEAVRQQVKRYQKELAGHIHRQGRTQFLDDVAVAILNDHRAQNPIVIYNKDAGDQLRDLQRANADLEEENKDLLKALNAAKDRIIELQGTQALLAAAEKETKLLEGFIQDAKAEIAVLSEEKKAESDRARLAEEAAQRAQDELQKANERERVLKEYAAACQVYNALSGLRRAFTKPPVMPELMEDNL